MELKLEAEKQAWQAGETLMVRLVALNDQYEPVVIDRRLLIGPNLMPEPGHMPQPINVEPAFEKEEDNQIILNPWCFYGRQRSFPPQPEGKVTFCAYLLHRQEDSLLPDRPTDSEALFVEAPPLVLTIR